MTIDELRKMLPGLPEFLGLRLTLAEKDRVMAEMVIGPAHCTLGDRVHGGTLMAFADTMGAVGTILNLAGGEGTTTIESKTNFFAGAPVGSTLLAETTPLHRGRSTQVWETRITNPEGRLIAKITQTQMVLRRA